MDRRIKKWVNRMHAYCLFCETQRCGLISFIIEKFYHIKCIHPQVEQLKWVKGVPQEVRHDWLPGYLFLYTEEPIVPRFQIDGIIRVLGRGELNGEDLAFARMMEEKNGVLGKVRLAQVGDRCQVDDPAWANMHGTVVKLDRGRKRCCVAFEFDKVQRNVWVGYEMVRKDEPEKASEGPKE